MKYANINVLSASDATSQTSDKIDCNQILEASFHIYFGDSTAAGTIQIQASNDINNNNYEPANFTVTNWVNIPNASATVTAGGAQLITIDYVCYRWMRVVYTSSVPGTTTINVNMFGISQ